MSSQGKSKKDKEIIAEYDAQVKGERRALRPGQMPLCVQAATFCVRPLQTSIADGKVQHG